MAKSKNLHIKILYALIGMQTLLHTDSALTAWHCKTHCASYARKRIFPCYAKERRNVVDCISNRAVKIADVYLVVVRNLRLSLFLL
jgi:hypothetical protein